MTAANDHLTALVDALQKACPQCHVSKFGGQIELADTKWQTTLDAQKLYDHLAEHFAAQQSGDGFQMLFEMRERIGELEEAVRKENSLNASYYEHGFQQGKAKMVTVQDPRLGGSDQ